MWNVLSHPESTLYTAYKGKLTFLRSSIRETRRSIPVSRCSRAFEKFSRPNSRFLKTKRTMLLVACKASPIPIWGEKKIHLGWVSWFFSLERSSVHVVCDRQPSYPRNLGQVQIFITRIRIFWRICLHLRSLTDAFFSWEVHVEFAFFRRLPSGMLTWEPCGRRPLFKQKKI